MELAKKIIGYANVVDMADETVDGKDIKNHPGPIIHESEITMKERQWQDVGSGVFARTFPRSERLVTTTRGGPPIEGVHRRTVEPFQGPRDPRLHRRRRLGPQVEA